MRLVVEDVDGWRSVRFPGEMGRYAPVRFLNSRDSAGGRVMGLEQGADDYLCNPSCFLSC